MRFQTKVSLLFGSLLVFSLVMVMALIGQISRTTVTNEIHQSLSAAFTTVNKLHASRVANLQQNVRLLAGDYGFKAAYGSGDANTIKSALYNHQERLGDAELMMLCDLDGVVLANTFDDELNGKSIPWMSFLDSAYDSDTGEETTYASLARDVYQLVVTPLLAPDLDAWIISGFRTDSKMAKDLSMLTQSDVTFVYGGQQSSRIVASSLDIPTQADLEKFLKGAIPPDELLTYRSSRETFLGRQTSLGVINDAPFSLFVQQSLDQALAPYQQLLWYALALLLMAVIVFALATVRLSRSVTYPITQLSAAADAVAKGNLEATVSVSSKDEIGTLTRTFNNMVTGLAEKEKVRDLLGKVVSPKIAKKLMSGQVEVAGEQREVSVLFCDIQGFTSMSERHPPKEVLHSLNQFFSKVSEIIEAQGGVIDKYMGDAVMAVFGAPQDDSQHAVNAVNAGIAICSQANVVIGSVSSDVNQNSDSACSFGIGIHCGPVVAGNIGSKSRFNYTVIGDTVNVAARLEALAGRKYESKLIVAEEIVGKCPGIKFSQLGEASLRGRTQPVQIYTPTELIDVSRK
ncbi:HAMP domain-containing protein [Gammaproteobacteria bacterium]|nr:HAMP domain-containing protein [Gammaproteobacteria bacterium]